MDQRVRAAALDLLTGSSCVACGLAGRLLCRACGAGLPARAAPVWPSPVPPGLVQPWAAAAYDGAVRALVVGHKERGLWALARPLGALLATSVGAAVRGLDAGVPVALVPVPSRPGATRARGHDPLGAVVARAARLLRASGRPARAVPLLRLRQGVLDQSGLDREGRAANLAGAMWCPSPGLVRQARRPGPWWVVVCDDVLTTGSTGREAQRALTEVGAPPVALCVVAASRLRAPPGAPPERDLGRPAAGPRSPPGSLSAVPLPPVAHTG